MNDSTQELQVFDLRDRPEVLPDLIAWYRAAWTPLYGPGGKGDAEADLRASLMGHELPICLVALQQDRLVGTVCLHDRSVIHDHLSPWITGLLVRGARRKELQLRLLEEVERLALRKGQFRLYIADEDSTGRYESLGWVAVDGDAWLPGPVRVWRRDLATGQSG